MSESNDTVAIDCGDSLDISTVGGLWEQLNQALSANQPVIIDGSAVASADTAGLQVLCSFFQDARAKGLDVTWKDASEGLRRAAEMIDVSSHIQLS